MSFAFPSGEVVWHLYLTDSRSGKLADDEAGAAAQPPDLLEHHGLDLQERLPVLGAGIEDDGVQTPQRSDIVEQRADLIVEAQIRRPDHRFSAVRGDFFGDASQLLFLAGDQNHQVARPCEPARDRLAETLHSPARLRTSDPRPESGFTETPKARRGRDRGAQRP